jgi:Transcriptional repressor TCF25
MLKFFSHPTMLIDIHRDLQRRGCNRTSFEFAKLMYSLDPWSDPHGALLHLDSLSIRAGMSDWLLDVWNFFDSHNNELQSRWNVQALPGWWYSRALALKINGNVEVRIDALNSITFSFKLEYESTGRSHRKVSFDSSSFSR